MSGFWELLKESVIIQAVVTLACVLATIYLVIVGRPVPDLLMQLDWIFVGFYFGSKLGVQSGKIQQLQGPQDGRQG